MEGINTKQDWILHHLCSHYGRDSKFDIEWLRSHTGLKQSQIYRALTHLENRGLIKKEYDGKFGKKLLVWIPNTDTRTYLLAYYFPKREKERHKPKVIEKQTKIVKKEKESDKIYPVRRV